MNTENVYNHPFHSKRNLVYHFPYFCLYTLTLFCVAFLLFFGFITFQYFHFGLVWGIGNKNPILVYLLIIVSSCDI